MIKKTFLILSIFLCSFPIYSKNKPTKNNIEKIKCIFDSKKTVNTEMLGLTEYDVGKKIIGQVMLIDSKSDKIHIHVVFVEGGTYPKFVEKGSYYLVGKFNIHNPTNDGKLRKFPVTNYRYFLVSSWKKANNS